MTTIMGHLLVASLCANALLCAWPAKAGRDDLVLARLSPADLPVPPGRLEPSPLGARDVGLYREVFRLQAAGDLGAADPLIAKLGNRALLGHVLWTRYLHPTFERSTYEQLEAWLARYADHPGADRIYALALPRRPAGAAAPALPVRGYLGGHGQESAELARATYQTQRARSPAEAATVQAWRERVDQLLDAGQLGQAEAALQQPGIVAVVDRVEADLARWRVARGHLAAGDHARALALASLAARRSDDVVPEIHWTAGLSAWRLGQTQIAGSHFSKLADAPSALPAERARAAFWAARAYLVELRPQRVSRYLRRAAVGRDFYGLLARTALGQATAYDWHPSALEDSLAHALARFPGAQRALALGQVGELERAEQEIRKLAGRASPDDMVGLIELAQSLDLPGAQMRLAQSLRASEGHYHLGALYPLPTWRLASGYAVDRALVYAIMRAESAFDPGAESQAGAQGLMQVMPATARDLANRGALAPPLADALLEPLTSIRYGQAYLEQLLRRAQLGGNLIYVAAAYNAGPRRVDRWRAQLGSEDDPLLFLESIPMPEARIYVKKVLTNLWAYRARLGQPEPSLQALARNRWPSYQALDQERPRHAWN